MNRFVLAHGGGQRIPLTIVGGPEGAGKTTLLRRLLTHNDGRHVAVVLDHPGALALNAADIARSDGNTLVLRNGSACLSLDGDIGTALSTLHARHGAELPDHVVVEAPALASPLRTSGYAYLPGFRPGGSVVVVSVPEILAAKDADAAFDSAFEAQLQHAELLILNQVDRVSSTACQVARRWLSRHTLRARMVDSERCGLPAAMILGTSLDRAPVHAIHGEWTPTFAVDSESRRSRIVQPRHEDDYRAWVLTTRDAVDSSAFRGWVTALPDSILRGDGVLRLRGEPSHRFQFHRCGLRWSLSRDEPWDGSTPAPLSWVSLVGFASASTSSANDPSEILMSAEATESPHFRPPLRPSKKSRPVGEVT
jgi:G3E family GTPase